MQNGYTEDEKNKRRQSFEEYRQFDVTRVPTVPQSATRSQSGLGTDPLGLMNAGVSPRRTDDILTDNVVHGMGMGASMDGMGQALRLRDVSVWYGFDNIRWWLLYPGRLEFLLWASGLIVLIGATILFVVALMGSLGGMFGLGVCR